MNRRTVLKGGIVLAVANHGTVATAETAQQELICDRIERLSQELSDALAIFRGGSFKAEVYPANRPEGVWFRSIAFDGGGARLHEVAEMRTLDRLSLAAQEFKRTAMQIEPDVTEWFVGRAVDDEMDAGRFSLIGSRPRKILI